jgi:hypothetical protein
MSLRKVTAWSTWNKKKDRWEHNHLDESGWVLGMKPKPKFPSQKKAWAGKKWKKEFGFIDENQVVTTHATFE